MTFKFNITNSIPVVNEKPAPYCGYKDTVSGRVWPEEIELPLVFTDPDLHAVDVNY